MSQRYFIELSYKGTAYSGFQIQDNAPTIQGFVQQALNTVLKDTIILTGSSRTDAGVHALQNYFHFDANQPFADTQKLRYQLNAILPHDIAIKKIIPVQQDMHARFSAVCREYKYYITPQKDPFLTNTAYRYNQPVNLSLLQQAAELLLHNKDFTSFSKLNTQVYTNNCDIYKSEWSYQNELLIYNVKANRFLRGMVRALVATMLKVGSNKITIKEFATIITSHDCNKAYFDAPAKGLYLVAVEY